MIDMRKMVDMIDMRKMLDRLDEKVILIVQVTHSIYAAFANFSAALQLLFILNFRLIITFLVTIFIGPESDHWLCLSLTPSLPN